MNEAITVGTVLAIVGVIGVIVIVGYLAIVLLTALGGGWNR